MTSYLTSSTLILVDLQNDFCENGALSVPQADEIIPLVNHLQSAFNLIIASLDWHPDDHSCFIDYHKDHKVGDEIFIHDHYQRLWPRHCVANSEGAKLHPKLNQDAITKLIYKGTDKYIDSYSVFYDNAKVHHTGLHPFLIKNNIKNVFICGLATDYCVKYSALDAVNLGFNTYLIMDACRGVNEKSSKKAIEMMEKSGVKLINSKEILNKIASLRKNCK